MVMGKDMNSPNEKSRFWKEAMEQARAKEMMVSGPLTPVEIPLPSSCPCTPATEEDMSRNGRSCSPTKDSRRRRSRSASSERSCRSQSPVGTSKTSPGSERSSGSSSRRKSKSRSHSQSFDASFTEIGSRSPMVGILEEQDPIPSEREEVRAKDTKSAYRSLRLSDEVLEEIGALVEKAATMEDGAEPLEPSDRDAGPLGSGETEMSPDKDSQESPTNGRLSDADAGLQRCSVKCDTEEFALVKQSTTCRADREEPCREVLGNENLGSRQTEENRVLGNEAVGDRPVHVHGHATQGTLNVEPTEPPSNPNKGSQRRTNPKFQSKDMTAPKVHYMEGSRVVPVVGSGELDFPIFTWLAVTRQVDATQAPSEKKCDKLQTSKGKLKRFSFSIWACGGGSKH